MSACVANSKVLTEPQATGLSLAASAKVEAAAVTTRAAVDRAQRALHPPTSKAEARDKVPGCQGLTAQRGLTLSATTAVRRGTTHVIALSLRSSVATPSAARTTLIATASGSILKRFRILNYASSGNAA